jgi:hypothetical protein
MSERGVDVYSILIPTSAGVMISSEYLEKIRCSDQGAAITYMYSAMGDSVHKVNIFNDLVAHNDEYIYFRTDHHWTALGAYYAYETFCAAAGLEAVPLENFTELDQGEYRGSFYYNCNQNSRLRLDNVYAYDPPGDFEVRITGEDGGTFLWTIISDMTTSSTAAKYMTFLSGDRPMISIKNNSLPDAPVCVVVKDSFGNPFVPFLTQHYSQIYVLDYRSYKAMRLKDFVEAYGVDVIIFAQALQLAQSDGGISLTRSMCR